MSKVVSVRWYQEPWAWFNLILLTIAIITASAMSVIALKHTPAEIGSQWFREGVLAKRERHQVVLIKELDLNGDLKLSASGHLTFTMHHKKIDKEKEALKDVEVESLMLYIEHPSLPEADQVITLTRHHEHQYIGQLKVPLQGKRRLMVTPKDDGWYLIGSAYFPVADSISFTPSMG